MLQQGGVPYAAVQTPNGLSYVPLPVALNFQQQQQQQQAQGDARNKVNNNNESTKSAEPSQIVSIDQSLLYTCRHL